MKFKQELLKIKRVQYSIALHPHEKKKKKKKKTFIFIKGFKNFVFRSDLSYLQKFCISPKNTGGSF